jgi:hypothetical protein
MAKNRCLFHRGAVAPQRKSAEKINEVQKIFGSLLSLAAWGNFLKNAYLIT